MLEVLLELLPGNECFTKLLMPCCTPAEPTYSAAVDADTELLHWQNPHPSSKMHNAFSFQCNHWATSVLSSHLTAASLSMARLSCLPSAFQSRQPITVLPPAVPQPPDGAWDRLSCYHSTPSRQSCPELFQPPYFRLQMDKYAPKMPEFRNKVASYNLRLWGHNYWLPVRQSWGCQPCNNAMKAEMTTRKGWQIILAGNCRLKHTSSGGEQIFAEKLFATHL